MLPFLHKVVTVPIQSSPPPPAAPSYSAVILINIRSVLEGINWEIWLQITAMMCFSSYRLH